MGIALTPGSDNSVRRVWFAMSRLFIFGLLVMVLSGCAVQSAMRASDNGTHQVTAHELMSASGCQYQYTRYQPKTGSSNVTLILGHGFLRSQLNMSGIASAVASRGVSVVTLNYCNMTTFNAQHERNAADMVALSRHLNIADPVYGGFSAGGLSALIAAAADNDTVAAILLDPVDDSGWMHRSLSRISLPVVAFHARPGVCNRQAQSAQVLDRFSFVKRFPVVQANHCDFEQPSDWVCRLFCGSAAPATGRVAQRALLIEQIALAVADINRMHDAKK